MAKQLQAQLPGPKLSRVHVLRPYLPAAILALTFFWYGALVLKFHTHGALGNDPTTYVQMALDLAARGSVIHPFPLFNNLFDKGFSWDALITPGYRVVRETGAIAPTYAFGFPLLLAAAYRVFGEAAFIWITPILGGSALIATFALGNELLRGMKKWKRQMISALAVLLLATSPKQIQLALVPMSDMPTQLFCVLAVWSALVVARPNRFSTRTVANDAHPWKPIRSILFAALCGFALGVAYLTRHSALVLVAPLALIAWRWGSSRRERFTLMLVAALTCTLSMLPDLIYRSRVLGSPLAVESPDSAELVLSQAPWQFLAIGFVLFSLTGFSLALALAPVGWWSLERDGQRWQAAILVVWILAFALFHAALFLTGVFENSLRYLLPAYPALALSIALGGIWIFERLNMKLSLPLIVWLGLAVFALVSMGIAVRALFGPERFVARTYGWMSETARRDLGTLNQTLPDNGVVGMSEQMAGAVSLYAKREVFRPAAMDGRKPEFQQFVEALRRQGRDVFLLGESRCAPGAGEDEKLPVWLEEFENRDRGFEIRDLPYECGQNLYEVK